MDVAALGFVKDDHDVDIMQLCVLPTLFLLIFQALAIYLLLVGADAAVDNGAFPRVDFSTYLLLDTCNAFVCMIELLSVHQTPLSISSLQNERSMYHHRRAISPTLPARSAYLKAMDNWPARRTKLLPFTLPSGIQQGLYTRTGSISSGMRGKTSASRERLVTD